jgi:DNA-damage-inducible protein J
MDEGRKREFDALCRDFGMSASTAFNVFARAVVRQRRIPFEIAALAALRDEASRGGAAGMTLDEVNAEISAVSTGMGTSLWVGT